ncbi:MAG: SDR family NAD(P)-dependent oxidoreductase [Candidatus Dormiibacterota bacterium]
MSMLEDRVAIVTGAGRGIGAGIARLFAAEGASVVVNDLGVELDGTGASTGPAQRVVDEIEQAGGRAVANTGDVSDFAQAEELVRQSIETFGKLDVLVNVAGILRDRMVFNMSADEWDAVIRVHLRGTFNTTRHAAAYWRGLREPAAHHRLINFTSVSGLHGAPGQPNYAAAKMGIVGFTYSCANGLGRYGVTANAISPGAATRMTESVPDERRRLPGDDERAPENVAPAVTFVASVRSDWLTGQVIGARGYEVSLYNTPQPIRQVTSAGPWDLERLATTIERSFGPALGRSAEVPAPAGPAPAGRAG